MATRFKTLLVIAVALVVASLIAALVWRKFGPQTVLVQHPTRGPAVQAVYATGTVEPSIMLPIAPRVAGRLTELKVDEGAFVKKAQVLARLEDQDLKNSVDELETRAQWAKDQFERAKMLVERGVGAANDRDRAKADWDAAAAAAAKSRVQRSYMSLLAPADGQILRRDGEVGQLIAVGQAVFYLSCCAPLRVTAEVDEEDIATVRQGQRVLIRADAFPGQVFEGIVGEITPKGDPVARSYRVRVKFGADTPLRIGMTVETNIVIEERQNALLVPAAAVTDGKVWLVRGDRLERRELHAGVIGAKQTEILQGLSLDDWVVTQPDPTLKAGRKVRPTVAPGAAPPAP
jgi:RND family efflux transporter MFP subunit